MRVLFLPDNLMACMLEEQSLFQSLIKRPFRRIFPIFKTNSVFEKIVSNTNTLNIILSNKLLRMLTFSLLSY